MAAMRASLFCFPVRRRHGFDEKQGFYRVLEPKIASLDCRVQSRLTAYLPKPLSLSSRLAARLLLYYRADGERFNRPCNFAVNE